jgi:hypothetical protein
MKMQALRMARNRVICPISHKSCKLCVLYRGRHYYSLPACKEYLRLLHEETVAATPDRVRPVPMH